MERWLSKPRVLLALVVALLLATMNRRDPLIYGMFLFTGTLGALAWLLPWASLRRLLVRAGGAGEVREGDACNLTLSVEQRGWWPVFMIEVQTHWEWAGRRIVLRHVVPVLRRGRPRNLGERMRFNCRGHYRLREVRLACGFPLGLMEARRAFGGIDAALLVLPKASPMVVPPELPVSHDDRGLQVTRRLGNSNELGALRDYEPGDPVRRIHWRASARAGHLVVQQYLQSGSPLLRVVPRLPDADEVGVPTSPGEQAVRVAAGLCRQALADGLRVRAYVAGVDEPLGGIDEIDRALAAAAASPSAFGASLTQACHEMQEGDCLVVVVPTARCATEVDALLQAFANEFTVFMCVAPVSESQPKNRSFDAEPRAARVMPWPQHR